MIRKINIHNVSQTLSQIGMTISAQNNNKQLNLQADSYLRHRDILFGAFFSCGHSNFFFQTFCYSSDK